MARMAAAAAGQRRAAVRWPEGEPVRRIGEGCPGRLGGFDGGFCAGGLLGVLNASTKRRPGFGCDLRPSIIGRSCATDLGRSECRTLRQVSMADRKPGRYPLLRATCDAGGMWS